MAAPAASRPATIAHRALVARSDRRWLLAVIAVFVGSLTLCLAALQVYRATGPHPEVTAFLRQVKHHARWLIPGLKGRPNWRGGAVLPMVERHQNSTSVCASGQAAQRAKA